MYFKVIPSEDEENPNHTTSKNAKVSHISTVNTCTSVVSFQVLQPPQTPPQSTL